jgi:phage terminase large subunit
VEALLSGKNLVCIREIQNSIADSVKRLIENRISELGVSAYFDITDKEIRCPYSGAVAIFRGMQNHTAESIKSLEGFDIAWWEEAQTASRRSLDLLIPTIRTPGSELWFSWNPSEITAPIEFLRTDPPENSIVRQVNWDQNMWFPEELRADLDRDRARDPDKFAHIWGGEYRSHSEARVFRNWREGIPDVPENVVWFYGADWGFANDPTAGVRCCFIGEGTLYIDAEVYEIGCPTEALPALLSGLPDSVKWPMRADSARPETIDYVRRHGFPKMRAATKGKGSVEDGITFLQGFDIVINPQCVNTIREFRAYAYKTDKQTNEILPVIEDANNHAIDALRYAVERTHRMGKLIKTETELPKKPRDGYGFDDDGGIDEWKVV